MVDLVQKAADEGYAIFFLTGRPATQEEATLGNLTWTVSASTPAIRRRPR
ncbi:MAG: hypothetical protein E6G28_12850 [Actinobacteria bacterium]|nr:MAG: hypothetical protein E6G28_12850 [Actinomycetota bacterium]